MESVGRYGSRLPSARTTHAQPSGGFSRASASPTRVVFSVVVCEVGPYSRRSFLSPPSS